MSAKSSTFAAYFSTIYPDKEIIPIYGEILALLGGGIHCVTQQQPLF